MALSAASSLVLDYFRLYFPKARDAVIPQEIDCGNFSEVSSSKMASSILIGFLTDEN